MVNFDKLKDSISDEDIRLMLIKGRNLISTMKDEVSSSYCKANSLSYIEMIDNAFEEGKLP